MRELIMPSALSATEKVIVNSTTLSYRNPEAQRLQKYSSLLMIGRKLSKIKPFIYREMF